MRYGIIGVFGSRNQGKTTYLVKYGLQHALTHRVYKRVYANIHIRHPDANIQYINLERLEDMDEGNERGIPESLVMIDQIHKYFDSRRAMSKLNKRFADVVIESRQHGFDIIYDTWGRLAVDPRLRRFTELLIDANLIGSPDHVRGFVYHRLATDPEIGGAIPSQRMTRKQAQDVWRWFDNNELVDVDGIPAR